MAPAATSAGAMHRTAEFRSLCVVPADERGRLRLADVSGFAQDRRYLGVSDEALPAVGVPVEQDPDPVALDRVAEHCRALGPVLLALLGALGREDVQEAV